jgi:hypothetical protein
VSASLKPADILDLVEYEKKRDAIRRSAMAARRLRRIQVGPLLSIAFENVETVKYQIQEMVRAERLVDEDAIRGEIDAYADLLPAPDSLAATLFIEIDDPAGLREWLPRLVGVEHSVSLAVGAAGVSHAVGEEGRSKDDTTSTVHYLRFPFSPDQVDAMRGRSLCELRTSHADYAHSAIVSDETVLALVGDLESVGA